MKENIVLGILLVMLLVVLLAIVFHKEKTTPVAPKPKTNPIVLVSPVTPVEGLQEPPAPLLIDNIRSTVSVNNSSGVVLFKDNGFMYVLTAFHVVQKIKILLIVDPKDLTDCIYLSTLITGDKKTKLYKKKIFTPLSENTVKFFCRNEEGYIWDTVSVDAKVIYENKLRDLAVVKVKYINEDIPPILGGEEPMYGDYLYIVGCPVKLKPVVVDGILGGFSEFDGENKGLFTGGTIYGNSGGGVYNKQNKLVGIVVAVYKKGTTIPHLGLFTLITERELKEIIDECKETEEVIESFVRLPPWQIAGVNNE